MRRPLTPNGVPLVQPGVAALDTIFDTQDLDPDYVYAVTLYCWAPPQPAAEYGAPVVAVGISTAGAPPVNTAFLSVVPGENFDNYRVNGNGPAKVMDRVPMRGNQQLIVAKFVPPAPPNESDVYWYGYFERVGEAPMPVPYRPLLPDGPSGLVSPYNAPVPGVVVPPTQSADVNVHQLDSSNEQRLDYLWLDISESVTAAEDGTPSVTVNLPGGVAMKMLAPTNTFTGQGGSPIRLFDGIPFRAPSSGDNQISLSVVGTDTSGDVVAVASGRFARV